MSTILRLIVSGVALAVIAAPLVAQTPSGRTGAAAQGQRGQTDREGSIISREPIRRPNEETSRPAGTDSRNVQVPQGRGGVPAVSSLGGQPSQTQVVNTVTTAVEQGGFVESDGGFTLKTPVDLSTSENSKTVEFQVGTIDGKPAYVPVELPRSNGASENEIRSVVPKIQFKIPALQACTIDTELVCVLTRDGDCVKYECVKKK